MTICSYHFIIIIYTVANNLVAISLSLSLHIDCLSLYYCMICVFDIIGSLWHAVDECVCGFVDEGMCSLWMIVICGLPLIACDCSRLWIVVS